MKIRNFSLLLFSAVAILAGCKKETKELGVPSVALSSATLEFEKASSSQTVELTATRDWKAEFDAEWLTIEPKSGSGSADARKITVTVVENTGVDREATVKFNIGFAAKTLTVRQKGTGSAADALVYYNDFDKQKAEKGDKGYPYLDQFDGWKNQEGKGAASVEYLFKGTSVRSNSESNGSHSDCPGIASGMNNIFFGKDPYFMVKEINLGAELNYNLSFLSTKYLKDQDNTFNPAEFHIYISNDATKWVELTYAFRNGLKKGRWDVAESKFTVPAGTSKLAILVKVDIASAYRLDDLKLEIATESGTAIDFSKGVDLGLGGGGTVTPPTPGETVTGTLAQLAAAADNATVKTNEVLVVAKAKNALLLQEGNDYIMVYNAATAAIGDKVIVTGTKSTYSAFAQIGTKDAAPTVEVKSSGNTVTHPAAKVLDGAALDAYSSAKVEMISFKGSLVISGFYYNITVDGAKTNKGSLVAPTTDLIPADASGKTVDVTGYYVYSSGKNKEYVSMIVVSATVSGDGPTQIDPALLTSNVTWKLEANAYSDEAYINGSKEKTSVLKIGTGKKAGTAKITLKKGTTKVNFFAIAWSGKATTLVVKIGDKVVEQAVLANATLAGKAPYNLVIDPAKDRYSINLSNALAEDTTFTVTTKEGEGLRAALFGIQAE